MKSIYKYLLILFALIFCPELPAEDIQCRPYQLVEQASVKPEKFNKGLLWEISRDDHETSYVFGTIHVDDPAILDLPEVVRTSLANSSSFVMEVVPAPEDAMKFSAAMFFMDTTRLDRLIPVDIYDRTVSILGRYQLTAEVISLLKPWAAFIIMSYPADMGTVLDLKLLELAQQNKASLSGLETTEEQIAIFGEMELEDQIRILADTVCHYENTDPDFNIMKSLYLEQDLAGLFAYNNRYVFADNSVYERVFENLVYGRNRRMVERIGPILANGSAFIAVGAMHLPGENGILNLLQMQNYRVTRIY